MKVLWSLYLSLASALLLFRRSAAYDVVYAVNCGGNKHTDRFGVKYTSDSNPVGIASDFGRSLMISRVHPEDMPLYQTERYHSTSFGYTTQLRGDGDYLVILKFAEVYFTAPGQKVRVERAVDWIQRVSREVVSVCCPPLSTMSQCCRCSTCS